MTGPSLTSSTAIRAPKTPRLAPSRSQKRSYSGSATSRRRGVDVARAVALAGVAVERELAHAEDLALAERLVHPPLGVVEDPQRADLVGEPVGLAPRRRPTRTPSRTSSPGPIAATRSPPTVTDARATRCTSARTEPEPVPRSAPMTRRASRSR